MLFLLFLFSTTSAVNVLVWNPNIGQSHVNLLGNIADVLHRAGHNVTVISSVLDLTLEPFGCKENVTKILFNSKYVNSQGWDIVTAANGEIWETELPVGNSVSWEEQDVFAKKHAENARGFLEDSELIKSLKNSDFAVGIAETFEISAVGIFQLLGVRKIMIVGSLGQLEYHNAATGIPQFPSFTPSWLTSFTDRMSFYERYISFKLMLETMIYQKKTDDRIQAIFEKYHPGFPDIPTIYQEKVGVILNNVNEFTETPRLRTNMIQYIGGSHFYVKPLSKEADDLLTKRNRTVLFSLGSWIKSCDMPLRIKKAFADAFASFPDVTFIWKYEDCPNDNFAKEGYENIEFLNWVPQSELLSDPRLVLFITHGGMNSILEASHAGVPIITIPIYGDQLMNAVNAAQHGIGIKLDRTKISKDVLVELIDQMIKKDSIYHKRAANMKHILKDRPEQYRSLINHWVERLTMQDGPIENLALATRDMNYFTIFSLDIIAVLLIVILFIFTVIFFVIRTLVRTLRKIMYKFKKE